MSSGGRSEAGRTPNPAGVGSYTKWSSIRRLPVPVPAPVPVPVLPPTGAVSPALAAAAGATARRPACSRRTRCWRRWWCCSCGGGGCGGGGFRAPAAPGLPAVTAPGAPYRPRATRRMFSEARARVGSASGSSRRATDSTWEAPGQQPRSRSCSATGASSPPGCTAASSCHSQTWRSTAQQHSGSTAAAAQEQPNVVEGRVRACPRSHHSN